MLSSKFSNKTLIDHSNLADFEQLYADIWFQHILSIL